MGRPAAVALSDWTEQAVNVIERLAREHGTVTSEDLRKNIDPPEHANQIGSAFRSAYNQKIIVPIGFKISSDKSRNGGAIRIWRLNPRMKEAA